ncbi:hypothetical protein M514_26034 [Trichuris suis]|uniref:Uncharacterized protein n=1 Tax=Trichuris suis TaxID=68888 RepID=A0A085MX42_9BILA|nr:hypothetical protein M514_26034 [Trichuris suis]
MKLTAMDRVKTPQRYKHLNLTIKEDKLGRSRGKIKMRSLAILKTEKQWQTLGIKFSFWAVGLACLQELLLLLN